MLRSILVIASVGMLMACVSGTKPPDTYTSPSGKTTIIESNSETCRRSCNSDYSRCMDTNPARNNEGLVDVPAGMFGASADCKDSLRTCLRGCNAP